MISEKLSRKGKGGLVEWELFLLSLLNCHPAGLGGGVFITPVGSDVITVTWYDQHHVTTETPKSSATPLRLYTCELLEPGPSVCLANSSPQHAGRQPEIGGQLFLLCRMASSISSSSLAAVASGERMCALKVVSVLRLCQGDPAGHCE